MDDLLSRLGSLEKDVSELKTNFAGIAAQLPHMATKADVMAVKVDVMAVQAEISDAKMFLGHRQRHYFNIGADDETAREVLTCMLKENPQIRQSWALMDSVEEGPSSYFLLMMDMPTQPTCRTARPPPPPAIPQGGSCMAYDAPPPAKTHLPQNGRELRVKRLMMAFLGAVAALPAIAGQYEGIGTVHSLVTQDTGYPSCSSSNDWFELNGGSSFGNCKIWNQGTMFMIPDTKRATDVRFIIERVHVADASHGVGR